MCHNRPRRGFRQHQKTHDTWSVQKKPPCVDGESARASRPSPLFWDSDATRDAEISCALVQHRQCHSCQEPFSRMRGTKRCQEPFSRMRSPGRLVSCFAQLEKCRTKRRPRAAIWSWKMVALTRRGLVNAVVRLSDLPAPAGHHGACHRGAVFRTRRRVLLPPPPPSRLVRVGRCSCGTRSAAALDV